ncbi:dynactin subunit 4, putative [Plasmodium berghei]|uniref:Dynactin subunit 4 n=2 Tax=Plasmodium berghei TaxID=5821 RepID=A0A509AQD1_PLABA|nr:dynactin subunit 4, putative [Plasmodium berghei ANKA]CXI91947.1 dynactin subunit 4, putative [Plasmodium berghei]SCL96542.1 dynactin subunit 4, putative [Plasmodium berghei]SCM16443.1 dynactin subunit 4, putative [Plasmodium berghei]SCM18237.1 dynactin subunit 4, putative [Plasmodium berghei]SCN27665.1 dynactin subunit 4, putative [Plasmodium berghei]|eukprot:XP_034423320.1 dynactin subunit 4, putative [Plasmodium berghei ANKA]
MKNRVYLFLDDKLFKLKELYFCVICSKIKNEYNIRKEVEYYVCNGCTQIYTKNEAIVYSYKCVRCFKCPFCFSCLTISQSKFDRPISSFCTLGSKTTNKEKSSEAKSDTHIYNNEISNGINDKYIEKHINNSTRDEDINFIKNSNGIKSLHLPQDRMPRSMDKISEKLICEKGHTSDDENAEKNKNILTMTNKMDSKNYDILKNGEFLFYFKCPYCLWASINTVFNKKLDELIGDMILLENNCIFRCFFKSVLNELIKRNEKLKEKKNIKRGHLNTHIYIVDNIHDNENCYIKSHELDNDNDINEIGGRRKNNKEKKNSSLIYKSQITINKMSLKDILSGEHIKNPENFLGIFELENENLKYLDPVIFPNEKVLFDTKEKITKTEKESVRICTGIEKNIVNDEIEVKIAEVDKDDLSDQISNSKNKGMNNIVIVDSKKYLSIEHTFNYPYNFYKDINELKPLRANLLSKTSKRCAGCKQYLLKLHNSNLTSGVRLNNCAIYFLPRIYINDFKIIKKKNGILNFILINPLDAEMNIKIVPDIDHNFSKHLNTNKITINCKSKASSFEFVMDAYDEIIDELLNEQSSSIKEVLKSKHIVIKKQNNMALIIISFIYTGKDDLTISTEPSNKSEDIPDYLGKETINTSDNKDKLNLPLNLECSFFDKSKKAHKVKLNLIFTNNIITNTFRHYSLNDA